MKKYFLIVIGLICLCTSFAQSKYSSVGGVESLYKDKYTLKVKLDEKTNRLSFETNAPVTVAVLETYNPQELAVRKGKEYTNTYLKKGNIYSYDLNKPLLKNSYAYWLKLSWGPNGAPLGEYFFKKKSDASKEPAEVVTENVSEETENDATKPTLKTNIKCAAGKEKVTIALKEMEGVFEVTIDIKTGLLKLNYSSDGSSLNDIIDTIRENGFDAEGKKSTKPSGNVCLKKSTK